jgi:hypothetical protein
VVLVGVWVGVWVTFDVLVSVCLLVY